MRILSEQEFQQEASWALRQVFIGEDPYDMPFAPGVEERLVLFPYKLGMEPPLLDAINKAAQHFLEDGFYVSILSRPRIEERQQPYHWYVSFADLGEYQSLVGPVENVVYSKNGSWGIMGSYEWHGLLGGKKKFIDLVKNQIPQIEQDVINFLDEWKNHKTEYDSDIDWIPNLILHVYGERIGRELLKETGLFS